METSIPEKLLDQAACWPELKRWERRELGQELRQLGLSYREIREIIPVPPGTLSGWCRDIPLTAEQQVRLLSMGGNSALGRAKAAAKVRRRSLERIETIRFAAREEAKQLASDPFWTAGVMAYWAEGAKRVNRLHFSNSDPALVVFFIRWSARFLGLTVDRLTICLHLHAGQEEAERKLFWSQVTGIPLTQFRKTFIKAEGTGHRKNILYNGTASIRVKCSTDLFHRVMGWIDALGQLPRQD